MTWTGQSFSVGQVLTAAQMNNLQADITALANGDSGAPRIVQGALSTTTGDVSASTSTVNMQTGPGGEYGFWINVRASSGGSTQKTITPCDGHTNSFVLSQTFFNGICFRSNSTSPTLYARQRYVQASPPYDLGDGQIPLFMFVEIGTDGHIYQCYTAPEAPWHLNGPTKITAHRYDGDRAYRFIRNPEDIDKALLMLGLPAGLTYEEARAMGSDALAGYVDCFESAGLIEIELDQAYKNRDMALLPAPMFLKDPLNADPDDTRPLDNTIVMLDPVSDLTWKLFEMRSHDKVNLNEMIHDGDIKISNTVLNRAGPPGVDVVSFSIR